MCEICSKTFKKKRLLTVHKERVHENRRPFKCDECGKAFKIKNNLIEHQATHTGIKPYQVISSYIERERNMKLISHFEVILPFTLDMYFIFSVTNARSALATSRIWTVTERVTTFQTARRKSSSVQSVTGSTPEDARSRHT